MRHKDHILNTIRLDVSNARIEATNNKFKNASAFLLRRARRVSAFHCARLQSAGGVYLSGGLKPATETSRILTYPPLTEAGIFPTEIKLLIRQAYRFRDVDNMIHMVMLYCSDLKNTVTKSEYS